MEVESTATYDDEERVLRASIDEDADGVADRGVERSFDEDGQLLEETVFFGGLHGMRSTYGYDAEGRLTRRDSIDAFTADVVREETYDYDARGNPIGYHFNRDPFSPVSTTDTRGCDERGRKIWQEVYQGGSNRTDRETWRYDAAGNVVRCEEDGGFVFY